MKWTVVLEVEDLLADSDCPLTKEVLEDAIREAFEEILVPCDFTVVKISEKPSA